MFKNIILLFIFFIMVISCGKKNDPEFTSKISKPSNYYQFKL